MVWAGCVACHEQRHFIGRWVDESELATLDPEALHQVEAFEVIVSGDHLRPPGAFTLSTWGVPDEQSETSLYWQARYADKLQELDMLAPMATLAAWLNKAIQDVPWQDFRDLYAGQWAGRPTRALRKRYILSPAGEGYYYMWRR